MSLGLDDQNVHANVKFGSVKEIHGQIDKQIHQHLMDFELERINALRRYILYSELAGILSPRASRKAIKKLRKMAAKQGVYFS